MTRLLSVREVRAELQCARSTAHKVVAQFGTGGRLAAHLVDRIRLLRPRIGYWSRVDPREAPEPDDEKYCAWCNAWWPLECFNREARSADGRRPECRACQRQRNADLKAGAARMRPWGKRARRALLARTRKATAHMAKKAEPLPPDVKVERFRQNMRCDLSEPEILERSRRISRQLSEKALRVEAAKSATAHLKAEIKQFDAEISRLSQEVNDGACFREVECERRFVFRLGKVVEMRTDTGAQTYERAMTSNERQPELPGLAHPESGSGDDDDEEPTLGDEPSTDSDSAEAE